MTTPSKPWEMDPLQNSSQVQRSIPTLRETPPSTRSVPALPPVLRNTTPMMSSGYNSYMPYSAGGYNSLGYGNYGNYGSYGMPYRSSLYNSYGSYGGYNNYGMYGMGGYPGFGGDDAERRFVQFAEESSRHTFASVESIVRAVNSISMMLDNTFFAMTSSFRAILSVAENFGTLRTTFGHIWYSINIFRLFNWLYRKLMWLLGRKVPNNAASIAWKQAANGALPPSDASGSSWPTIAFLGVLLSAPYIISKFLPKYEDKGDPTNWKTPGVKAKAAFDFVARTPNELSIQTNDEITLAPATVQEELNLKNTGWLYAEANGKCGVVPLNYLVISKSPRENNAQSNEIVPKPAVFNNNTHKTHTKRVSFGENQIFENVDLEDYVTGKKEIKLDSGYKNSLSHKTDKHHSTRDKVEDKNDEIQSQNAENTCENIATTSDE